MSRKYTAVIMNKGRQFITLPISGHSKWVTVLEVVVRDSETGEVLNKELLSSGEGDTITLVGAYEVKS